MQLCLSPLRMPAREKMSRLRAAASRFSMFSATHFPSKQGRASFPVLGSAFQHTLWLAAILGLGGIANPTLAQERAKDTVCVMTFNLRYASPNPPNAWSQRRPVMRHCIEKTGPDLIGTQEGLYQQVKDLTQDLPQYDCIGLGRDGGSRGGNSWPCSSEGNDSNHWNTITSGFRTLRT